MFEKLPLHHQWLAHSQEVLPVFQGSKNLESPEGANLVALMTSVHLQQCHTSFALFGPAIIKYNIDITGCLTHELGSCSLKLKG